MKIHINKIYKQRKEPLLGIILYLGFFITSCNKLVTIDPPTDTIVSEQAFSNDYNANTSVNGLYSKLVLQNQPTSFGNGAISIFCGTASDELIQLFNDDDQFQFYNNEILSKNGYISNRLWQQPYATIYGANACLEQLKNNPNLSVNVRDRLIGESKFIRSFCYFYLVNMFGDVPYLASTDYKVNSLSKRTSKDEIYSNIISDLESSVNVLPNDYSLFNSQKIRCTKWAAMALLARTYLYTGNWAKAEQYANMVISSNNFSLSTNLNDVFLTNSSEAILQLAIDGSIPVYNVTPEGLITVPRVKVVPPNYSLPQSFINEFEPGDKRFTSWIDSSISSSVVYYFPYKYKMGPAQRIVNGMPTEYYMVLRLAEQYLIRAEARAHIQNLSGAADDVNIIRTRAGLGPVSFSSLDDAIDKILAERKKELFYEWGNRWFDLKRTGKVNDVMSKVTPLKGGTWSNTDALFPIPVSEMLTDPNLIQNAGY